MAPLVVSHSLFFGGANESETSKNLVGADCTILFLSYEWDLSSLL